MKLHKPVRKDMYNNVDMEWKAKGIRCVPCVKPCAGEEQHVECVDHLKLKILKLMDQIASLIENQSPYQPNKQL